MSGSNSSFNFSQHNGNRSSEDTNTEDALLFKTTGHGALINNDIVGKGWDISVTLGANSAIIQQNKPRKTKKM